MTSTVSISKQIGGVFFVVGTEVGAGILALPILIVHVGFPIGCLVLLLSWLVMTYTALLLCEINLAVENGSSFAMMAKKILGASGEFVAWFGFLIILYSIILAYISAAGSSFSVVFHINSKIASALFVMILGSFVIFGLYAVDIANRILLSIKLALLLLLCFILLPQTRLTNLLNLTPHANMILTTVPIFIASFTSHLIIPSLRMYLKSNTKVLIRVVTIGSIIPLVLYLIWIIGVVGLIPHDGSHSILAILKKGNQANVGDMLNLVKQNTRHNDIFYTVISWFSSISITTSFLGISLSLYHFLIDGLHLRRYTITLRTLIATTLTFILPFFIVYFLPNIFIRGLSYVGLCCSILLIIMPVIMIKKLKQQNHIFKIRYVDNNMLLNTALLAGITTSIVQILS